MRIACPSCNAVYQVPTEQLGEGRLVRCVRCSTDWLPVVAVPAAGAAEPVVEPVVEPIVERVAEPFVEPTVEPNVEPTVELGRDVQAAPEAPGRRMALDEGTAAATPGISPQAEAAAAVPTARRAPWLAIAWVVSILAVGGGVAALVVWREAVMAAWPPSVRAYAGIGLATRP